MTSRDPRQAMLRRPKADPCADFWHTLKVGVPVAVALFLILPFIL